jgi:hypothetical protein
VNGVNVAQHLFQAFVAARTRAAALDAKTITLAHHMQIRKVRHAPAAASVGTRVEIMEVARWRHGRIGECRSERGTPQIDSDQHDAIRKSHGSKVKRRNQIRNVAHPPRAGPDQYQHQQRERANENAGGARGGSAPSAAADFRQTFGKRPLDKLLQALARKCVARLDDERVQ